LSHARILVAREFYQRLNATPGPIHFAAGFGEYRVPQGMGMDFVFPPHLANPSLFPQRHDQVVDGRR
jgi:hypothetical protein